MVLIRAGALAGTGTITANGGMGVTPQNDGGAGGGAGGSVVVTVASGTVNGLAIAANGANGTNAWPTGPAGPANRHGPGGGGAGGAIFTSNALPAAQTSVLGGAAGTTTNGPDTYGATGGATGVVGTSTAIPGSGSGAQCLPVPTTSKTTSTPTVTNSAGGTTATYTITVANAASVSPASGVSISDALHAGFTYASTGSITLNGGATRPAIVNPTVGDTNPTFGTFTIPSSGSVVITFTVAIAPTVGPGTYNNPVTATYLDPTRTSVGGTASSGYPGGGPERVTVLEPDMTIAKSHTDPFVRGTAASYTLVATNTGNSPTTAAVTVSDTLPAGLTPTSASGSGWTCPAPVGQTISCSRADLLAGAASYPAIAVSVTVLQSSAASVTNVATVAGGGELIITNDQASDPTNIVSRADIAIGKTVGNPTPNQGTNVTFTITAMNNGPSNATGVAVTDLLPAGLSFVTAAPSVGTYNQATGVWTVGPLLTGSTATLQITATVTGTSTVINTATKTAEDQPDPNPGNDSASASVSGQAADIGLTKTVSNPTPNQGSNVTFTVTATNHGPSAATGVVVGDLLPAGLSFVSAAPSVGTYNSGTGVWTIGALANGSSATLQITATVTGTSTVTNTATKTAEDQPDLNPGNDSASASVTGQPAADIAIDKLVDNSTPAVSQDVRYTLAGHNLGPSAAPGVMFRDLLPAGVQFVGYAATQGTYDPVTGIWNVGTMADGATVTLVITVTVTQSGTIVNTATTIPGVLVDPNVSNDSSSATIQAGLPGLPNTSGPVTPAGLAAAPAHGTVPLLIAAALGAALLALGFVFLGTTNRRRALLASVLVTGLIAGFSTGSQVNAPHRSASTGLAAPALSDTPATRDAVEVIGGQTVTTTPPVAAPTVEAFHAATGPIIPSRLRIPTIGVDAPVGGVGLRRDGSMSVPDNLWTAAWLATGPRPGEAGRTVLAGHRGIGTPALFSGLEQVHNGDRIFLSDRSGAEVVYAVVSVTPMDLSSATQQAVFGPTSQRQLVVVTCFGRFLSGAGTYNERLVVTAQQVSLGA